MDPLPSAANLDPQYKGDYGDAYLVGTQAPFDLYVWTRSNQTGVPGYWFDWGPLNAPSTVPGPAPTVHVGSVTVSDKVAADVSVTQVGKDVTFDFVAPRGSRWFVDPDVPYSGVDSARWDCALDASTGDVYQLKRDNQNWDKIGNIRGPEGPVGPVGPQGPMGPTGPQGEPGAKGEAGQFINIVGKLNSTSSLPDPRTTARSSAYLIPDTSGVNHIWLISGEGDDLIWVDAGSFGEGGTKVSASDVDLIKADLTLFNPTNENTTTGQMRTTVKIPSIAKAGEGSTASISYYESRAFMNLANQVATEWRQHILPIADSDDISTKVYSIASEDNPYRIQLTISDDIKSQIQNAVQKTSTGSRIYGTTNAGGQTQYILATTPTGSAIVQRQSNGNIQVPVEPIANTDAVCKGYVDNTEDLLQGELDTLDAAMKTYVNKSGATMTGVLSAPNFKLTQFPNQNTNPTMFATFDGNSANGGFSYTQYTTLVSMMKSSLFDLVHPIGSIVPYVASSGSLTATQFKNNVMGGLGTWEEFAQGQMLIGKASSGDFSAINSTGGSKNHRHANGTLRATIAWEGNTLYIRSNTTQGGAPVTEAFTGMSGNHVSGNWATNAASPIYGEMEYADNMPPYRVIQYFRRTA